MKIFRYIVVSYIMVIAVLLVDTQSAQAHSTKSAILSNSQQKNDLSDRETTKNNQVYSIPLQKLGYPDGLRLTGISASKTFYVPLDPDLHAKELNLNLQFAPDMPTGKIWIDYGSQTIAAETLPRTENSVWSISLSAINSQKRQLPLTLHMALKSNNICSALNSDWITISRDSTVKFSALNNISTPLINHFIPPYLKNLYILIPAKPSKEDVQAVFDIADYVTYHYSIPPHIRLRPLGTPIIRNFFTRSIVVGGSSLAVIPMVSSVKKLVPALQLGPKPSIAAKALFRLPVGMSAMAVTNGRDIVSDIKKVSEVTDNKKTLAALGYPDEQVNGLGNLSIAYRFSQADLGGPVHNIALHFAGVNTPIFHHAFGYLGVKFNGVMVYSHKIKKTKYDFYARIPNSLLERDNTFRIFFQYTPPGGACIRGSIPFQGTVYNASYLQFKRGEILPSGFNRFPTVFANNFPIYLQNITLRSTKEALLLIKAMQKTTRLALHPEIVSTLPTSGPLLFIGDKSPDSSPLQIKPFVLKDRTGRNLLRFSPGSPFAALQGYGKTLALAGPAPLRSQLLKMSLSPDGWYALRGDVVIQGVSGSPLDVRMVGKGLVIKPITTSPRMMLEGYSYWLIAFLGVVIIGFLIWAYPRLVRKGGPIGS